MSALLDTVTIARELRDDADGAFVEALQRAHEGGHSLREIGRAAGMTHAGVRWILRREESDRDEN